VACLVVLRSARSLFVGGGWVVWNRGRVGGGVEFRHTVGVLRDQARCGPGWSVVGVGVLWLFDLWIVDASIARTRYAPAVVSVVGCGWCGCLFL
jgi:hypothetical protein